ncbi:MAG: Pvc16 family protein [Syntrophomonas sp.]|nr:Pvc16 family protein [Syntrophomonas sp.]
MADYSAIAEAGASIIEVLRDNLCPDPISSPDLIGLCSPAETDNLQLGLYLYSIKQNREYRRDGDLMLSLTLYYILTAYSDSDIEERAYDESFILGAAIQVLNENCTLGSAFLQGSLGSDGTDLRVDLNYLTPEEMHKIWLFPNVPYRTSIGYMVYPIIIEGGGFISVPRIR